MKEGGGTEECGESNFDSYSFPSPPSSICPLTHPSQKLPLSSSTGSPIAPPHPEHCVKETANQNPTSPPFYPHHTLILYPPTLFPYTIPFTLPPSLHFASLFHCKQL